MEKNYASTNQTASTSTVPDKYWDDLEEGYKAGFDWAVKKINERFIGWLLVGFCIGNILMFFANSGFLTFASVLGLIYLVGKVTEIEIKKVTP